MSHGDFFGAWDLNLVLHVFKKLELFGGSCKGNINMFFYLLIVQIYVGQHDFLDSIIVPVNECYCLSRCQQS